MRHESTSAHGERPSAEEGLGGKSTPEEIRERFDADVERFSNLETGQTATIDAALALELVAEAAPRLNPQARRLLDVGCGAGNYSLKLLERLPGLEIDLLDLSRPMLERAVERLDAAGARGLRTLQVDIRAAELPIAAYDLVTAAATLHHLRGEEEWRAVFAKLHRSMRDGGTLWIVDLVEHSVPGLQTLMWERYGAYLAALGGDDYRDHVLAYVEREDSPRPLLWQLELLKGCGFRQVEVLHKNGPFATYCALK